jgi:hypothetical protein
VRHTPTGAKRADSFQTGTVLNEQMIVHPRIPAIAVARSKDEETRERPGTQVLRAGCVRNKASGMLSRDASPAASSFEKRLYQETTPLLITGSCRDATPMRRALQFLLRRPEKHFSDLALAALLRFDI